MINKAINTVYQSALSAANTFVDFGKAWASAIIDMRRISALMRQQDLRSQDKSPQNVSSTVANIGDLLAKHQHTTPQVTTSSAKWVPTMEPQPRLEKQPEFPYDNDYPVSMVHKNYDMSAKKTKLKVIGKPQGWIVVFQDKIAYQPKPGAWLTQSRTGSVLSEMLKQANQQFVGHNSIQQQVEISGYDKQLNDQLSSYVFKQPHLILQPQLGMEPQRQSMAR